MRRNDLSEFKLEQDNFKITLRRGAESPVYTQIAPQPQALPYASAAAPAAAAAASGGATAESGAPREKLREILSPMVGTFYASPSPEAGPYVSAGREVTEDTVVCIIEAMKVMNEIKAEMTGTVVEVVAENGKPVQYGQVLFRVR